MVEWRSMGAGIWAQEIVAFSRWLPQMLVAALFVVLLLAFRHIQKAEQPKFRKYIISAVMVLFAYAAVVSVLQYSVWANNPGSSGLLNVGLSGDVHVSPIFSWLEEKPYGYFVFYVFGHFWLEAIITVGVAFAFYWVLKIIGKHRDRYFDVGDKELGLLGALVSPWPLFVPYIFLFFISVVGFSIWRGIMEKKAYTTMGGPFLFSAFLIVLLQFFARDVVISLLNLRVLVV